ncbi:MAG TPA: hypothetical protein VHC69_34470 [Polyangiaceae bacterium]|nr:hypothetical protein [Polyangiaceae bacterium]
MAIRSSCVAGLCVLSLATFACEEKKTQKSAEGTDAGPPRPAVHGDKTIVDALKAEGSAEARQGPPESGVYAPGAADKELKIGDPPKFIMGLTGSEPKVQLTPAPAKPAKRLEGKVEVGIQTGPRSAMPTIELGLTTEPADKTDSPAAGPLELLVKASSAKLAADQPGQLPPGADKQIGKLKGSHFTMQIVGNSAHVTALEPAKDVDESLALVLRAASDAWAFTMQPVPTNPVGKDGFWMVESREQYLGLDAVVWRMYKVVEAKPQSVMLDVSVKRLVSAGQLGLPGIPPHHVDEFNDNVTGRIEVSPGDTSNIHADLTDTIMASLTPEGPAAAQAQGQHLAMQMQIKTRVASGR